MEKEAGEGRLSNSAKVIFSVVLDAFKKNDYIIANQNNGNGGLQMTYGNAEHL